MPKLVQENSKSKMSYSVTYNKKTSWTHHGCRGTLEWVTVGSRGPEIALQQGVV